MSLHGKVAVVTGASRGIGRGIALQLGEAGAKVYITGRDHKSRKNDPRFPTLERTAEEITKRGGKGIPVVVDHSDNAQVKKLFEKVANENNGQLDILVNNAFSGADSGEALLNSKKFWEDEPEIWDLVNNVGLRSHYVASVYAARLFVKHGHGGLIVNTSSQAAKQYAISVANGVGKAGVDRLTVDTALELKPHNVTVISIWPGLTKTEYMQKIVEEDMIPPPFKDFLKLSMQNAESSEYAGKCIIALITDSNVSSKTGKSFPTALLGKEYGLKDIDGREINMDPAIEKLLENLVVEKSTL
uniref:Uncharacterized protein n=1 Tax=Acrobeloides nanus TaxID=290746 RepID=A0A914CKT0_9BILA